MLSISQTGGCRARRGFATVAASTVLGLITLFGVGGCDTLDSGIQSPDVIVEGYLIANEPLRRVRVSRIAPIEATYDFTDLAVRDAEVSVSLLAADGSVEETYVYTMSNDLYFPLRAAIVQPLRAYRLEVRVPGQAETIRSTTFVPGAFEVLGVSTDSVVYQGPVQVDVNVSRSVYPGRQTIFVFSTRSRAPSLEQLTPFYNDVLDPEDESDVEDVLINESPPINEGNYDVNPDGTLTVTLPWLAVAFYGPNEIIANAIDENLYDLLRSQAVQQGGSTLSPGEIPNVINHVDGGAGIFGSLARTSTEVYIAR